MVRAIYQDVEQKTFESWVSHLDGGQGRPLCDRPGRLAEPLAVEWVGKMGEPNCRECRRRLMKYLGEKFEGETSTTLD